MRKEQKTEIVEALKEQIQEYGNFYVTDISSLTVEKVNNIRRKCFDNGIKVQAVKNTLIRKTLEAMGGDYEPLFPVLKGSSTLMFSSVANAPAKVIKSLRNDNDGKPVLKAAYIDASFFIGDNQLDALVSLKSKEELIGEIIGLLQSPAKNVVSSLQSSKNKLAGIVKTLQERG